MSEMTAETRAQAMVSRWIGTYTVSNAGTVQNMMVEVETVAEIAAGIRDAERVQSEELIRLRAELARLRNDNADLRELLLRVRMYCFPYPGSAYRPEVSRIESDLWALGLPVKADEIRAALGEAE